MLAIRPRAHTLLVLVLLLLITTLLLLLLHADPAHAFTDPNEPADNNNVMSATHAVWWVQVQSLIGNARIAAYHGLLDGLPTPYDWFRAATRGECVQVI